MKKANDVITAMLLALAFAFASGAEAKPRPDGGPTQPSSTVRAVAANEAAAQSGTQEDILPIARINFAPVGLTMSQTVRLNLVNMDVPNGISVSCRFIDASGITLAQSVTTLSMGKTASVDYKRHSDPLPGESPEQLRAEVRLQLDILTFGVSSDSLRRSLEVFDNYSGATIVYMGGGL